METVKNTSIIRNFNKFNKMSLSNFVLKKEKYIIELNLDNYNYLYAIKSGELSQYKDKKDLEKIKRLSNYFFGTIPLRTQKDLLEAFEKTPLKLLYEYFPEEYVRYLNARIYVYDKIPS